MSTYTMTIFDNEPNASSGNPWPHFTQHGFEARDDEQAVRKATKLTAREGESCGEYEDNDVLWVSVWGPDGAFVETAEVRLSI